MSTRAATPPKHRQVFQTLQQQIQSGHWKPGDRLPSEVELVRTFGASRITVGRAVRDLQTDGLVERRAGSGTYVRAARTAGGLSFGLLIPDLGETEIFEPMCQGMMASPLAREHALVWGSVNSGGKGKDDHAWQLCRRYIERRVSGVFFAPLEITPRWEDSNQRIVRALDAARIPVVLLDRPPFPYPERGHHDLVGIDNRRAGLTITAHLARQGCRRIAFVALPNAAATVSAREAGYREALYAFDLPVNRDAIRHIDPAEAGLVRFLMDSCAPDGIVCANDRAAGRLMRTLLQLGYAIPADVRLVGIDDVEYASLLPVPLTTLRQPTLEIGDAAISAMLDRIRRPHLRPRDIFLQCELIVRASCGAYAEGGA